MLYPLPPFAFVSLHFRSFCLVPFLPFLLFLLFLLFIRTSTPLTSCPPKRIQNLQGCASLTPSSSGYYFVRNATFGAGFADCNLGAPLMRGASKHTPARTHMKLPRPFWFTLRCGFRLCCCTALLLGFRWPVHLRRAHCLHVWRYAVVLQAPFVPQNVPPEPKESRN